MAMGRGDKEKADVGDTGEGKDPLILLLQLVHNAPNLQTRLDAAQWLLLRRNTLARAGIELPAA